jgi:2-methylcitrate dehydratase PrpD
MPKEDFIMDELTTKLAEFATKTQFRELPEEVVHETKRILLDSIGCAVGAYRMERGRICTELALKLGGPAEATILGTSSKVARLNAAFANGELINALDYDANLGLHMPPFIIPAPLAMAETASASGKSLILSIAIGHEIATRLQMAAAPTLSSKKNSSGKLEVVFAPVSGHGTAVFGAAVGAAKILDLNLEKMANTIGIAGYAGPPSTFRKWTDTAPCGMMKYGPAGFTAEVGLRSALLAEMGYYADKNVFEGDFGYGRFSGFQDWDTTAATQNLGSRWKCAEVSYKKYPCGH